MVDPSSVSSWAGVVAMFAFVMCLGPTEARREWPFVLACGAAAYLVVLGIASKALLN